MIYAYIESLRAALAALREEEKLIRQSGVAAHGFSITQVTTKNKTYARLEASTGLCPNGKGTMSLGKVGSEEHRDWGQRIKNRCKLTAITRHAISLQRLIEDEDFVQVEATGGEVEPIAQPVDEPVRGESGRVCLSDRELEKQGDGWLKGLEDAVTYLSAQSDPKIPTLGLMPRRVYSLFGSLAIHENQLRKWYSEEHNDVEITHIRTALRACKEANLIVPVDTAICPRKWKKVQIDWPSHTVLTPTGEFTFLGSPLGFDALKRALGKKRFEAALVHSLELKSA